MSNRRVKSFAVDDDYDDYDDYDEDYEGGGDEVSEEDKEQLRQGTIKVRAILGPSSSIAEKEIHEALWHYYYDVGKSVAYLTSRDPFLPIFEPKLTLSDKHKPQVATKKQANENKSKFISRSLTCNLPRSWWS